MRGRRTKLILLLLGALLALTPLQGARAQTRGSFLQAAYTGAYGEETTVTAWGFFDRAVTFTLRTEDGRVLGRQSLRESGSILRFTFPVTEDLPRRSVLQLLSDEDDDRVLDETLLFCDVYQNVGIRRVGCEERRVALTFDSGAKAAHTREILDLLDKYQVKATFFLIGQYVEENPAETALIADRGHELANHTYDHPDMGRLPPGEAYENILKAQELLQAYNGGARVLYRPPSGVSTFRDRAIAWGMGTEVVLWSVDSGDGFEDKMIEDVVARVNRGLHNGGMVLMHVYGWQTLRVLDIILPLYQQRGYTFVTVSELLLDDDEAYVDQYGTQQPLRHGADRFPDSFSDALRLEADRAAPWVGATILRRGNGAVSGVPTGGEGIYRARVAYRGDWAFVLWAFDAQDRGQLLVSWQKNYDGRVLLLGEGPYAFDVEANDSWSIQLERVPVTRTDRFSGRGDDVTDMAALPGGAYRLTHEGKSNFLVWAYTTAGEQLLLDRLGPVDEIVTLDVPEGSRVLFAVRADGDWTIAPAR